VTPPSPFNFGSVNIGSSAQRAFTITNTGNATLKVQGITVTAGDFTLSNVPATPFDVGPGLSSGFSVTFAPTTTGLRQGMVALTSNASPTSTSVALSGTGASSASAPDITVFLSGVPNSVLSGATFQYNVSVYNAGNSVAQGAVLTETFPSNVAFACPDFGGALGFTCMLSGNTMTITMPDIIPLRGWGIGSGQITAPVVTSVTNITMSATVSAANEPDAKTGNNSASQSITVNPPSSPMFAYVSNAGSGDVSAYAINGTTGALTSIPGSPFAAGTLPWSVTVGLSGRFAYVANSSSMDVSAYKIDSITGALTPVPGSPFAAGSGPYSVAVDPFGRFAYVANGPSNDISAYTIDANTGALTPIAGSPFAAGSWPRSVTVDPSGRYVYTANYYSDGVSAYTIDATTGALSPILGSVFAAGTNPLSVTVDRSGRFAYVANYSSNDVSAYTINAATGALSPIPGSPFAAGTNPQSVTVDRFGRFAYIANYWSNDISAYTIDATTGALTPIAGSPFAAGLRPFSVAVDPSGRFAYVPIYSYNNISAYTINPITGALTPISGSPFAAGANPTSVTTTETASTELFSNFGPGDAYNFFSGRSVEGVNNPNNDTAQTVANPFIPPSSSSYDFRLAQIELGLSLYGGANSVIVELRTDSSGVPGELIEAWPVTNMAPPASAHPPVVLNSVLRPLLARGVQYWIVARPGDPTTWAGWNDNSIGDTGIVAYLLGTETTWRTTQLMRGAYRIRATPVP
jgi:uncharacterized repeat protein (TIGR01451 family)